MKLTVKAFLTIIGMAATTLFMSCTEQNIALLAPANETITTNNMPTLAWSKVDCEGYQVWIDNIKMAEVNSETNAYTAFPLAFGQHTWKVVAIKKDKTIESAANRITIKYAPLSHIPAEAQILSENWKVQSSLVAGTDGKELSSTAQTDDWYNTSIPSTVLTALVRNGLYPNPYVGMNNMLIPDCDDGYNNDNDLNKYSHIKGHNPWSDPYWFVNRFTPNDNIKSSKNVWLTFNEINYKAEIWLNGNKIGDKEQIVGMERSFKIDIKPYLNNETENILAVEIFPVDNPGRPAPDPVEPLSDPGTNMADGMLAHDYTKWDTLGWDWQPPVRDRDMGITEEVFISGTDNITIDNLYVSAEPMLEQPDNADIAISADITNHSSEAQKGVLKIEIEGKNKTIALEQPFTVAAESTSAIMLDKNSFDKLHFNDAQLWWPYGYGEQNLYKLTLTAQTENGDKAASEENFGIRKVVTYIGNNERVFEVNGRKIYPKGGNWVIDMMLNWNGSRYEKEILLTRNANLNMLRVWGPTGVAPEALFDAADKYGILMWQDFLNDFWGTFRNTPGYQPDIDLFEKATIEIVKRYRNHPSLIMWCGGNEGPNPREELIVNNILKKYDDRTSRHYLKQSDGDGLHGGGPYHTMEPIDYFAHPKLSGFSSEIGPSGIPVAQSIDKFMPEAGKSWLAGRFPLDGTFAYHDANDWPGNDSRKFTAYDNQLRKYYGAPDTTNLRAGVNEYVAKAQIVNYDVYRAAIESINRNLWDKSSGILLWKSNSSWPSLAWQVYDWYLQAHAGYYGAKRASEPVHAQLNRDNNTISLVNLTESELSATVEATLYDKDLNILWQTAEEMVVGSDNVVSGNCVVPETDALCLLKLCVRSSDNQPVADNFYWLGKQRDYSALTSLPKAELSVEAKKLPSQNNMVKYSVRVKNSGKQLAFMTELKIAGSLSQQELLPSLWSDNYFTLLPEEEKEVTVELFVEDIVEEPILLYGGVLDQSANKLSLLEL